MSEERLSSLALIHTHYDTLVDLDEAFSIFARIHPRRLELDAILYIDTCIALGHVYSDTMH